MPNTIQFRSEGPVGPVVDALVQSILADWPEPERTRIINDLRANQAIYDDAATAAAAAAASRKFTTLGLAEDVKRVMTAADGVLKPREFYATKLTAEAETTRAKAHQPPAAFQRRPDVEREIRDRLVGLDPLLVNVKYREAIAAGDWEFILAVEAAPKAFALLTAEMREEGDALKLLRSPLAPQLVEQETVADLYRSTLGAVRTELAKLAERYGVNLAEV